MADATRRLIAFSFDSELRAGEFAMAAGALERKGKIEIQDAVFVVRNMDDEVKVSETADLSSGPGSKAGSFWGALLGIFTLSPILGQRLGQAVGGLTERMHEVGVSKEFAEDVRQTVRRGTTVLILMASDVDHDAIAAELPRFGGTEMEATDFPDEAVAALEEALEADAAEG